MRAAAIALAALASMLAFGGTSHAQAFSRLEPGQQAMTLETGLQSGVATSVGYVAGVRVGALNRTVMPFLQGTLLAAHPDLGDYAVRGGAQVSLLGRGWFDLSAQLALGVAETENSIHRATALQTDVALLAGHYGRSWFLVGEGGYGRSWMTYIKSTDFYRAFYPGAKDGWYRDTAGAFHLGLKGGFRLGAVEILLRAGATRSEALNDLDLPFYAMVGTNYRF